MPFPFVWIGMLVAALVLGLALAVFGAALRLLAHATDEVGAVLPGLVAGFREWAGGVAEPRRRPDAAGRRVAGAPPTGPADGSGELPPADSPSVLFEELPPGAGAPVGRLHGRVGRSLQAASPT